MSCVEKAAILSHPQISSESIFGLHRWSSQNFWIQKYDLSSDLGDTDMHRFFLIPPELFANIWMQW